MTFGQGPWGRTLTCRARSSTPTVTLAATSWTRPTSTRGGESERLVGTFIADSGSRDEIVLATKFAFNASASPLTVTKARSGNPNAGGTGAKKHPSRDRCLVETAENPLHRSLLDAHLGWRHSGRGDRPNARRPRPRRARSDIWIVRHARMAGDEGGDDRNGATRAGPIAMQVEYSLVARDVESEHFPAARKAGWSDCRGARSRAASCPASIVAKTHPTRAGSAAPIPLGNSKFTDRNWAILDALRAVAAELDRPWRRSRSPGPWRERASHRR